MKNRLILSLFLECAILSAIPVQTLAAVEAPEITAIESDVESNAVSQQYNTAGVPCGNHRIFNRRNL